MFTAQIFNVYKEDLALNNLVIDRPYNPTKSLFFILFIYLFIYLNFSLRSELLIQLSWKVDQKHQRIPRMVTTILVILSNPLHNTKLRLLECCVGGMVLEVETFS